DALGEPALYVPPFLPAEHARDEVQRERPFVGGSAHAAGLERDPLLHEDRVASPSRLDHPLGAEASQLLDQRARGGSGRPVLLEQLVQEGCLWPVPVDRWRWRRPVEARCLDGGYHREILPRSVRLHLRRMEKLAGPGMLTCRKR